MAKKIPSTYKLTRPGQFITVRDAATGRLVEVDKLVAIDAVTRHIPVPTRIDVVADPLDPEVIAVLDLDADPPEVYAALKVVRGGIRVSAHIGKRPHGVGAPGTAEEKKRKSLWAYLAERERKHRLLEEETGRELPKPWAPAIPPAPVYPWTDPETARRIRRAREEEEAAWKDYVRNVRRGETEEDREIRREELRRIERQYQTTREPREYVREEPRVRAERPEAVREYERAVEEEVPTKYPPGKRIYFRDKVTGLELDADASAVYGVARNAFNEKGWGIPAEAEPLDIELSSDKTTMTVVDVDGDYLADVSVANKETKVDIDIIEEDLRRRYPSYRATKPSSEAREEEGEPYLIKDSETGLDVPFSYGELEDELKAVMPYLPGVAEPFDYEDSGNPRTLIAMDQFGNNLAYIGVHDKELAIEVIMGPDQAWETEEYREWYRQQGISLEDLRSMGE